MRVMRRAPWLLVAALLLAAQWLVLQHETRIDLHADNQPCAWCLAWSHVDALTPAPPALPAVAGRRLAISADVPGPIHLPVIPAYRGRAPPADIPV